MGKLVFVLLIIFFLPASAQIREQKDGQIVAAVSDRISDCYFPQEKDNWCWAASVQMALAYQGLRMSQYAIVKQVFGRTVDQAASAREICAGLDGLQKGKKCVRCWTDSVIDLRNVILEIQKGNPLVVGVELQGRSHAMVLSEIRFKKDNDHSGRINPTLAILQDPSRRYLRKQTLNWSSFCKGLNMVLHLQVYPIFD